MTTPAHPLWRPMSGCGPACLPLPGRSPAVSVARQLGRAAALLAMVGLGVGLVPLLPVLPARERQVALRGWARATARACGVRLEVRGRLPRRRALLVANHVSWWDILAVLAISPARLVAKREVGRWPLVGLLARAAGTVFVDRSRPRELPATVDRVAAALGAGRSVAVFPEGTTWCGADAGCRPSSGFRPAMFQAAIDAGAPVVPLRIGYRCAVTGEMTTATAFVGDETLLRSVRRLLAVRELTVSVEIGAPLHPGRSADRRALARVAESAVHLVPSSAVPSASPASSATTARELRLAA
ncbi:1-acyl-sn-glycerol-3-phosphate acyltransferases [Micromonospora phaseoli]|uniref:1-acyl-sn-glycerol-3-phosphate acyltransferases n=1 Tax=Micromonospora phaseoli TaxID=1144548 RepID=A0A1H6WRH9_9ACTN|nr:lysophospholipid acyltransferase family protein [Micromonospora phaseoli]PZW01832.1 1-acyl-sn-glycerol-3-phosphate acyltransferase [Micromonospora phaseoli]GIJ78216.1 1-acyl-sn-glycerol-3-phosphate acyltransferase [Micromonospora phaseoli]SEJ16847.1 1-acyl-sn-glycerol-3-phosphate acyltransferases [Micromonospora phaseoli]